MFLSRKKSPSSNIQILRKIISTVFFYSGVLKLISYLVNYFQFKKNLEQKLKFPFIKKRDFRNFQILAYHQVNDDYNPFFPAIPVNVFARQMEYLASHFKVFSLEEA